MDLSRIHELEYRISHKHKDGAWGEMSELMSHHTSVEHDPERQWGDDFHLFKCTSCDEWAMIRQTDEHGAVKEEAAE
jgi:hypothetical protein